ncbi:MAG: efflux RND transporter periplasmic adaptor subunit [Chloroflexota bacterium]
MKKVGQVLATVALAGAVGLSVACSTPELSTDIVGSGFVEASGVGIAVEAPGRIVEISVNEGDRVEAGRVLVRLDDSLLKARERQAMMAVGLSRASLNQAAVLRDGARKVWEGAVDVQKNPLELEARIIAARASLDAAKIDTEVADYGLRQLIYPDYRSMIFTDLPGVRVFLDEADFYLGKAQEFMTAGDATRAQAQIELAKEKLATAEEKSVGRRAYIPLEARIKELELEKGKAAVDSAGKALQNLLDIKKNPQEINARVDQAHAGYQGATAAVEVAQRQVEQTEASLEVIRVQLDQLSVASPLSGVVADRFAEVGEVVQPGVPVLRIMRLDEVTLTTYVAESRIGLVKLGQEAIVTVDSYPGESFSGRVVFISPQALFTPKNIQLREEREKMVFPVKVRLANPQQKLKPGMPADARIVTVS